MKLLVITSQNGKWSLTFGADSALLRPGEPVFLPESLQARSAVIPAVRICRLGFCVRSNFRSYYDAVSLFHYLDDASMPDWLPPYAADRTFSPGAWEAIPDDGILSCEVHRQPLPGRQGEISETEFTLSLDVLAPDKLIREISQYCTLKTGDILLFPDAGSHFAAAEPDTALSASLNGTSVLDIRLK